MNGVCALSAFKATLRSTHTVFVITQSGDDVDDDDESYENDAKKGKETEIKSLWPPCTTRLIHET